MLVMDLQNMLERLAPAALAQAGDNSGLLIGDEQAAVKNILAALELTEPVLDEAEAKGCDTILTHHPLLYSPVSSLLESGSRERLLRRLVAGNMTLIACHTNLDAAAGGLAEIAGEALGLRNMIPLVPAPSGWYKLVGFVPEEAVEAVAAAVFEAGAGSIGDYQKCAFALEGTGWYTAGPSSSPVIGKVGEPERTPELRWETVVPRGRLPGVLRAFVGAHPYEEPAFDIYPVDDVLPRVGLGRVGTLVQPVAVRALAGQAAATFEARVASWSGDGAREVQRVGVLPGSGSSLIEAAAEQCEVLITGDTGYHDAERAAEGEMALIDVPHGEFEWWAFKHWAGGLATELDRSGTSLMISREWGSHWKRVELGGERHPDVQPVVSGQRRNAARQNAVTKIRIWLDGGSRGNPGPGAIGVVIEDEHGTPLEKVSRGIGVTTNNVAEYRALLEGLEMAERLGATDVDAYSDSELLVKQMLGEYKVKNVGLKPLHAEAKERASVFASFAIHHVGREENARADELVNRALDADEGAGL